MSVKTRLLEQMIRRCPAEWGVLPNGNQLATYDFAEGDLVFTVEYTKDLSAILKIDTPFGSTIGF